MHELGLVKDLVGSLKERLSSENVVKVKKVFLKLGKESEFSADSLKFWFKDLSKDSILSRAELEVEVVEGKGISVNTLEVD